MSRLTSNGEFEILDELGSGAMGSVHRAKDTKLDRSVALKFLHPALASNRRARERFEWEGRTLAKVDHQSIPRVWSVGEDNGLPYMAMEIIEGRTLDSLINEKPLPLSVVVPIFCQVLDGLGKVHEEKIVHRDLKPANIMLTDKGLAKVIDFGVAHVPSAERKTRFGAAIGTPAYMSPEQARGKELDERSDIYSLGAVLFELVAGKPPLEKGDDDETIEAQVSEPAPSLRSLCPESPEGLDKLLKKALDKNPARRFQTTGEFRAALTAAVHADLSTDAVATYLSALPKRSTLARERGPAKPTELDLEKNLAVPSAKAPWKWLDWKVYVAFFCLLATVGTGLWIAKMVRSSSRPVPPPTVTIRPPGPPPVDVFVPEPQVVPPPVVDPGPPVSKARKEQKKSSAPACSAEDSLLGKCSGKEEK